MDDLFSSQQNTKSAPLAERMRPRTMEDIVGQEHLFGKGKVLQSLILADKLPSLLLWGPPGSGKTSIAEVIANTTGAHFIPYSAVTGSIKEVRGILEQARLRRGEFQKKTILFVDEIHRFNKAQQDAFLPAVEKGILTLIGATTENPSFEVNNALLSRCRVLLLYPLGEKEIETILQKALAREFPKQEMEADVLSLLAKSAQGDARKALSALEVACHLCKENTPIDRTVATMAIGHRAAQYDKKGEGHYDTISAFIKSMRGSDPDAAVYYLARQLESGEDPLFLCRRMIIFAAEDIGNADPMAFLLATQTFQAVHVIGMPEAKIPMSMAATYLASAPKSKAAYYAIRDAMTEVKQSGALEIPKSIRNAPTQLMKELGYGKGYRDPHREGGFAPGAEYLPKSIAKKRFYQPTEQGYEAKIARRLEKLREQTSKSEKDRF